MARDDVDMTAVQRDARLVQALSSRSPALLEVDPIAPHLAAWVADIDRGIDPSVVVRLPERDCEPSRPSGSRRRRALTVAGATVMALAVSTGAAAAVTGDPLMIVRAPLAVIQTINPFAADHRPGDPARDVAGANQLLADAQRAIAQGDLELAAELLEQVRATGGGESVRLDQLTDRLAEVAQAPEGQGPKDKAPKDKGPKDKGPKDQGPKDKGPKDGKPVDQDPVDQAPVDKGPQGEAPADGGKGSPSQGGKNDTASGPGPADGSIGAGQGGGSADGTPGQRGQAAPDKGTHADG